MQSVCAEFKLICLIVVLLVCFLSQQNSNVFFVCSNRVFTMVNHDWWDYEQTQALIAQTRAVIDWTLSLLWNKKCVVDQPNNLGASSIFVLQWHNWVKWAKRVWNRIQMYDAKQTPDDHERVCWKTSNCTIQQYLLFTELLFCLVRAPLIALIYNLVDSNHFPC